MASYQVRQRDPLLDQGTAALLERRGRELLGLVLLALSGCVVAMLYSYSPNDPGWMVATDEPAANLLGRFGAAMASTLIIIGGQGAWGIPLVLAAWGLRFVLNRGADRALGRMIFSVIAIALGSVYAATLVPGAGWPHSFGLGGLFGDTVLGSALGVVPFGPGLGLKLLSVLSAGALLGMMLFVTGFDPAELRALLRFFIHGLIISYDAALGLVRFGAHRTAHAATAYAERRRAAAVASNATAEVVVAAPGFGRPAGLHPAPPPTAAALRVALRYPEPLAEAPQYAPPRERIGLLARMPQILRRSEPELVETQLPDAAVPETMPNPDRIRARITDVINARTAAPALTAPLQTANAARREPPVLRAPLLARGPAPLIADTRPFHDRPSLDGVSRRAPLGDVQPPLLGDLSPDEALLDDDEDFAIAADWQTDLPPFDARRPAHQTPSDEPRRPAVVVSSNKKPTPPSKQAQAEAQPALPFGDSAAAYELPPLSLLAAPSTVQRFTLSHDALEENARMLESVLDDYGVKGEITSVRPGPVVTMYELEPAPGLKASRVIGLADDIARSMSALSARVSTVPGRTVIGIELPNATREKVVLREILSARDFGDSAMRLPLALGKDIGGEPIIANLAKMPHLLIAGTTGSGKSVAINTMILSLLYKLSPDECRLIMIDPKMLELSVYDGIPHLLSPVVTDPKKAVVALKWVVSEMEDRYRKMSKLGVRNIEGYNGRVREALAKDEMFRRTIQTGFDDDTGEPVFETDEYMPVTIPYIVVVVDEMADLMMVAGKEIEACIQRLAQMARASGIHLIMATQRPSVDVITGTIKANFPTRISFQVTSKIDSRTILGEQGAEQLLGMGDMLYMAGGGKVSRIHGPFVSDEEVEEIVNHLKSYGPPVYMSGVVEGVDDEREADIDAVLGMGADGLDDSLYDQAVAIVARDRKCSTSYIQRKLGIGYNKAAKLVEQMEEHSVVTPANHVGKREILVEER